MQGLLSPARLGREAVSSAASLENVAAEAALHHHLRQAGLCGFAARATGGRRSPGPHARATGGNSP